MGMGGFLAEIAKIDEARRERMIRLLSQWRRVGLGNGDPPELYTAFMDKEMDKIAGEEMTCGKFEDIFRARDIDFFKTAKKTHRLVFRSMEFAHIGVSIDDAETRLLWAFRRYTQSC